MAISNQIKAFSGLLLCVAIFYIGQMLGFSAQVVIITETIILIVILILKRDKSKEIMMSFAGGGLGGVFFLAGIYHLFFEKDVKQGVLFFMLTAAVMFFVRSLKK